MLFVLGGGGGVDDDDVDDDDVEDGFHSLMMMLMLMLVTHSVAVRIFSSYIRFWFQFNTRLRQTLCLSSENGKDCF